MKLVRGVPLLLERHVHVRGYVSVPLYKHKSFLQSRRSGRVKNLYVVHSEKLSGELLDHLAALSFALPPEHAIVIAPFISSVKRRVLKFTKK